MGSVERLALLCAGSTHYHEPLGGGHASGQLSRVELAGLLKGLSAEAMNLALAKFCGDEGAERMLIAQVREWTSGLAAKEQWEVVRGRPTLCNMGALAVFEAVRPNRCVKCNGCGFVSAKFCPCCGGSGVKALAVIRIAEICGIPETSFRRDWNGRYRRIVGYVDGFHGQVFSALRKNCVDNLADEWV